LKVNFVILRFSDMGPVAGGFPALSQGVVERRRGALLADIASTAKDG